MIRSKIFTPIPHAQKSQAFRRLESEARTALHRSLGEAAGAICVLHAGGRPAARDRVLMDAIFRTLGWIDEFGFPVKRDPDQ
jgi:hypothetical protein